MTSFPKMFRKPSGLGAVAIGLGVAVLLTAAVASSPARADDRNWRDHGVSGPARGDDRDWRDHEMRARHWHVAHPHPVMVAPMVYAPPVVYAPPPPPMSGINLIVPLNFR
jgi:hypothetical protein